MSAAPVSDVPVRPSPALATKIAAAEAVLADAAKSHGPLTLASSLSAEDMVLTDMIARLGLPISAFTLETGRLHAETLEMIPKTKARYSLDIEQFRPRAEAVDAYVQMHGLNAIYESLELRKACCAIRKVEPLERALAGKAGWITGQRRDQSQTRAALTVEDWDDQRGLAKFNPLADWSWQDVLDYAAAYDVPLNPLHARGYVSIGCEPCTRAIRPGEDPRAGRWWWENSDKKECGLHLSALPEAGA